MKTVYAVVNHIGKGQVDVAYTSEERAYREIKKIVKDFIENEYDYYGLYHISEYDKKKMRKLLNKKFDFEVYDEVDNLLRYSGYEGIGEDYYILPIVVNP